jgi:hypothetical protein
MVSSSISIAAVLLHLISTVIAHGDEHGSHDKAGMDMSGTHPSAGTDEVDKYALPSYAGLDKHSDMILTHIVLMILAWFFILPIGKSRLESSSIIVLIDAGVMFSIGRSRLALPVQFLFLALNGIGVIVGTVYNIGTPDLYENNAHHKIGWIATWVMTAQVIMGLLFMYSGRTKTSYDDIKESTKFLPMSAENMAGFTEAPISPYHDFRWSGDTEGHERSFSGTTQNSRDISPEDPHRASKEASPRADDEEDDDDEEGLPIPMPQAQRRSIFRIKRIDSFLSKRMSNVSSKKLLKPAEVVYDTVDRTILILGWIALVTGGVTYAGILVSPSACVAKTIVLFDDVD